MYEHVTEADLARLRALTAPERVLSGAALSEDYSHDELGDTARAPEALVRVLSTREVADVLRYANERRLPVVARGSGTGLVGGCVPLMGGLVLETTKMNSILELDADNLTVTVQPGVLLMELAEYVQAHGFFYPPDPGEKSATIGGNISTNAGGMRAVKYGVTRDYVRGLTVVLPSGEVLTLGGKVVKNSSGYALKELIVGSEGTLGVVTEAVLRLLPLPEISVSLLCPFAGMREAIEAVPELIRSKQLPTAVEYLSRETLLFAEDYLGKRFPDTRSDAYLLLTFDGGDAGEVEREYTAAAELCLSLGALDVYLVDTEERKQSVWNARGAFLEAIKASTDDLDECDVVVPRDRVAEYILYTHELAEKLALRIPSFGHAGDGNLHIYLCRDRLPEPEWLARRAAAFDALYERAAELGGQVSGEHGIGCSKKEYLRRALPAAQLALMRGIKASFDPNNILNPGKIFD